MNFRIFPLGLNTKCILNLDLIKHLIFHLHHFIRHDSLPVFTFFSTDEEIGGHTGMAVFIKDERFKQLNVGFALDEGEHC